MPIPASLARFSKTHAADDEEVVAGLIQVIERLAAQAAQGAPAAPASV
ncbi:hypothetical protein ACFWJ5_41145 [Streptomyces qaidamensis]